jgi:hypothetical protein
MNPTETNNQPPLPPRDRAGRHRSLFILGAILFLTVLVVRFALSPAAAAWFVTRFGYWTTLLAFAIFVWFLVRALRAGQKRWRTHWRGLLVVLLGSVVLQVQEPHRLRVMYDEYTLLTTSLDMHLARSAATASYAVSDGHGHLAYLGAYVEKRQLFFPFLLSLVHDVAGYRPANVFVLNALVGTAFLVVVYAAGVLLGGSGVGVLGVLLATGLPLVAQNATGGGYDLLSVTMMLLLFVQTLRHLRAPTRGNAELLVITVILAAQVRDESLLLGLLVVGAVGWGWWRTRRLEMSWFLALSPLLLLTPLLINLVYFATPAFFESVARGSGAFGMGYFSRNLADALHYLYNWEGTLTNSPLLSWLGTAALLLCVVWALRNLQAVGREGDPLLALLGFAVFGVGFSGLILFYFWGQLTDPVAARLSFPLQAAFLLAILGVAARILGTRVQLWVAQGVAALFLVGYTLPVNGRHAATRSMTISYETEWAVDYVGWNCDQHTLCLAYSALPYLCHGRPAVPVAFMDTAPRYFDSLCDDAAYRQVLVLEVYRRDARTGQWVALHDDMARYCARRGLTLEPLAEKVFLAGYVSRISRLVRRPPP